MSYKITFSKTTRKRLKEIGEYIAKDNPKRARSFVRELKSHLHKRLSTMPFSGREVEPGIRMIPFKRYTILYRVLTTEQKVLIVDIFGGGQDWQQHI